jgi:hypothetical protein
MSSLLASLAMESTRGALGSSMVDIRCRFAGGMSNIEDQISNI